jgi:hypothetical protein
MLAKAGIQSSPFEKGGGSKGISPFLPGFRIKYGMGLLFAKSWQVFPSFFSGAHRRREKLFQV